jgi:hypothetical protein
VFRRSRLYPPHLLLRQARTGEAARAYVMRTLGRRLANDEPITVSDADWRQHQYVIGASGGGKTNYLETLMAQDLAAGRGFCFIDKHGDSAKRIADSAEQSIVYWKPADLSYVISLNQSASERPARRALAHHRQHCLRVQRYLGSGDGDARRGFCITFEPPCGFC